jgi:hypothetical protein
MRNIKIYKNVVKVKDGLWRITVLQERSLKSVYIFSREDLSKKNNDNLMAMNGIASSSLSCKEELKLLGMKNFPKKHRLQKKRLHEILKSKEEF